MEGMPTATEQEQPFPSHYCVYDSGPDDDFSDTVSLPVDDNGFPLLQYSDQKDVRNGGEDDYICKESEDECGFTADFYRCGTDWSSLLLPGDGVIGTKRNEIGRDPVPSGKKLKQVNLFQMWRFKARDDTYIGETPTKKIKTGNSVSIVPDSRKFVFQSNPNPKRKSTQPDNRAQRVCPFYKKFPGTPFTVDAFRYGRVEGCSAYFLTHFHYDHYGGLNKSWSNGPIYCSTITACLVQMCLSVNPLFICPLELNAEYTIEGVKVTLLEANHCPGAALIHFHLPNGQCYLHTGDFRACKNMQSYPLLINQRINVLYLDTTYCNSKYRFPPKEEVLSYVVKITKECLEKQPRTLVVVGAYSIGKECVYLAISKALGVKIYTNAPRRRILHSFDWPELSGNLCANGKETWLHVLPISSLRFENLKDYLNAYKEYAAVLAFRPTGWTYSEKMGNHLDRIKPTSKGNISIYGVPYSEHSSFTELQEFVQFLRPEKIIPTVNVWNAASRAKMQSCFRDWLKG